MAIKKSELYSSLWASCDSLKGGMDASQYKDYVLVLLFIKYVSDKYAGLPFAPITVPEGASFTDMVALKGKADIGDQINKSIIAPLQEVNRLGNMPDFNDDEKLGKGKEMVEKLSDLISIFENPALNFKSNSSDGDDILGDAYEYLMRHFATESGKSKGQFYTPAEVSRILSQVIGIADAETTSSTTAYDPTCGSGSLLLKVGAEAEASITLYGQEMDSTTAGLARMNMILHDYPTAVIKQGNTLAVPQFIEGETNLTTFDFVVANPPFSDKRWSYGVNVDNDPFERFKHFGCPPDKQGDYAYLLHIIRSLKSTGKGACILPHGVLFRGNAEAGIRENLIKQGFVKGIIGLPANLFYGTGIPACVIVLDKQDAQSRKGIFMVDASAGFMKDGNKNRLRDRDLHKIVDAFNQREEIDGYSRMVGFDEIEKNEYNLNIPRYIDSSEAEDVQDIAGHLQGGIPSSDLDALQAYWEICPTLRASLFESVRDGYEALTVEKQAIKTAIYEHSEFSSFIEGMNVHFEGWKMLKSDELKQLDLECQPKQVIRELAENLLEHYEGKPLIDHYAVYQHLMDYWSELMQDDAYLIASDGWKAETYRVLEKNKKTGKEKDKGWTCDLIPKELITARYFIEELQQIAELEAELDGVDAEITELEEEHGGEDGAFAELEKINKVEVAKRIKELKGDSGASDELTVFKQWTSLNTKLATIKKKLKEAEADLDKKAYDKYPTLTESEIKVLAVDDKWLATLDTEIHGEMDRISQSLTQRVKELAERYETPLGKLTENVADLEGKVAQHIERMGFSW